MELINQENIEIYKKELTDKKSMFYRNSEDVSFFDLIQFIIFKEDMAFWSRKIHPLHSNQWRLIGSM